MCDGRRKIYRKADVAKARIVKHTMDVILQQWKYS